MTAAKGTYAFVSLGCPKNLVDSERMLGTLAQQGYALSPQAEGADVVVVNTCGFIEPAREESLSVIREMLELKKQGRVGSVVVAGCLPERLGDRLLDEVPEVDQILGVFAREEITAVVDRAVAQKREQRSLFRPAPVRALEDTARLRVTPRHYAYLKISEGCDRLCTFCAIPKMRGKHVTKPIEEVIREANELALDGVRELIVVAQDSTYYGMDIYGRPRLADLIGELDRVDGIEWVRLLYAYPEHVSDELLAAVASSPKVIPYLDMPLQHATDRMLKRMQRRVTRASTEELLGRMRSAWPGLTMRTTFIVGFPGETDADVDELIGFVREQRFERVGVFPYSLETDTPAAKLPDHLPELVKLERRDRVMEAQQSVAFDWASRQVGKTIEVIIDGPDPEFPGQYVGRGHADAPDIDGLIHIKAKKLSPGDIATVKITGADGYDLMARASGRVR